MPVPAQALATLLKQTDIEDHEEVLRAAEIALKQSKGDAKAQHARVIALLKLDRYDDAVKVAESANLQEEAALPYAYALYKSGRAAEAVDIASKHSGRGFKHVEAQARYRLEDFGVASNLYQELASDLQVDASADLRVNGAATDAQLTWAGNGDLVKKTKASREDLEAFESAYNAACGSISRGEFTQGEVLLKRAKNLVSALDDMTAEEKEAELVPITIQQIYLLARLGKHEEADALAQSVETRSISDASTRRIAQMNSIAASSDISNPFLTQRLVSGDAEVAAPDHPFRFQSIILKQNRFATDLQSLKFTGTAESTSTFITKQAAPCADGLTNSLSVVNAAAHAKSQVGKEALKHILPLLERRPNDVGLILTIVHLYMLTGNPGSAANLLEKFLARLQLSSDDEPLDIRYAPGLVGTMVSLYHLQRRKGPAQQEFAKAAAHWKRKSKWPGGVSQLMKAAGTALIESPTASHQSLAGEVFQTLHKKFPEDQYASAGVLASSTSSTSSASTRSLTPVDRLTAGINIDALEAAGIAQASSASSATAGVTLRKRPAEDTKPAKAKRPRKSRLPKDYDPSKAPDPERWLPLRDRSSYRPKGKKGKARANLLSQGAAPAGESDGSRPGTPGGEIVKARQAPGGGGSGAGAKKKKAKGRR